MPLQKFEFKLAQVVLSIFFSFIDNAKGLLSKAAFARLCDLRLAVYKIYPSSGQDWWGYEDAISFLNFHFCLMFRAAVSVRNLRSTFCSP